LISLLLGILSVVMGYFFWTFTIHKVGQWFRLNPPKYRELLCPIGFAYSPQILNVMTVIPLLGRPIELILAAWTLLAVTIAVRQAMTLTTLQAALLSLACFPVIQIVSLVVQVMVQQL
jgi:Yip1 domain